MSLEKELSDLRAENERLKAYISFPRVTRADKAEAEALRLGTWAGVLSHALKESEAREAVAVEALKDIREKSVNHIASHLAELALADASPKAKALLAVVEAARKRKEEYPEIEHPGDALLWDALARLERTQKGETK